VRGESKDFCHPLCVSLLGSFIFNVRLKYSFMQPTSLNLFTCLVPHHLLKVCQHPQTYQPRRPNRIRLQPYLLLFHLHHQHPLHHDQTAHRPTGNRPRGFICSQHERDPHAEVMASSALTIHRHHHRRRRPPHGRWCRNCRL